MSKTPLQAYRYGAAPLMATPSIEDARTLATELYGNHDQAQLVRMPVLDLTDNNAPTGVGDNYLWAGWPKNSRNSSALPHEALYRLGF